MRLRLRYAKRGRLRFTSHRDFSRAFERALVRARIPMAYSSGFNPHPRISYAGAAPTGAASEAEYVEIGLREVVDPADVLTRIDQALPPGLDVLTVVLAEKGALADRLEASHWRIMLPEVDPGLVGKAVDAFLVADEVLVERMTKRGLREFDCRAAVVSLAVIDDDDNIGDARSTDTAAVARPDEVRARSCAILDLVLRHGTPAVRPDDILVGLQQRVEFPRSAAALFQRLAQGFLDPKTGTVGDPLVSDRDAE